MNPKCVNCEDASDTQCKNCGDALCDECNKENRCVGCQENEDDTLE